MTIFNLWGSNRSFSHEVSDQALSELLATVEQEFSTHYAEGQPLKSLLKLRILADNPRLKGKEILFSHYADYVFKLIDYMLEALPQESDITPEALSAIRLLHVQLTRLAFEDESFINHTDHPVRHFLNQLLGHLVGSERVVGDRVLGQIHALIASLDTLVDFSDSASRALEEIIAIEAQHNRLGAKRIANVIAVKFQNEEAEELAGQAIAELLDHYRLPGSWKKLLKLWKKALNL